MSSTGPRNTAVHIDPTKCDATIYWIFPSSRSRSGVLSRCSTARTGTGGHVHCFQLRKVNTSPCQFLLSFTGPFLRSDTFCKPIVRVIPPSGQAVSRQPKLVLEPPCSEKVAISKTNFDFSVIMMKSVRRLDLLRVFIRGVLVASDALACHRVR